MNGEEVKMKSFCKGARKGGAAAEKDLLDRKILGADIIPLQKIKDKRYHQKLQKPPQNHKSRCKFG